MTCPRCCKIKPFLSQSTRHRIGNKWHKWQLCKIFLGLGKIFKNERDKLPFLWNLPNSGLNFYKITGVTLYLRRNLQKDWQFVQNIWVNHPTLSFFCKKTCRDLHVIWVKLEILGISLVWNILQIPCLQSTAPM